LVIADSNGKAYQEASNFPDHTQILAFSGLKIPDVQDLLINADKRTLQNVKTIVVAVGVNNRGDGGWDAGAFDLLNEIVRIFNVGWASFG